MGVLDAVADLATNPAPAAPVVPAVASQGLAAPHGVPEDSAAPGAVAVGPGGIKKGRKYPPLRDFKDSAVTESVVELVRDLDPTGDPPEKLAETVGCSYAATWQVMTGKDTDLHPGWVALVSTLVLGVVLVLKMRRVGTTGAHKEPEKKEGLGLAAMLNG